MKKLIFIILILISMKFLANPKQEISQKAPFTGTQKMLIVLVDFPDMPFTVDNPCQALDDLMNQSGYRQGDCVGSVRDYFWNNSLGKLDIQTTVIGPFRALQNQNYYDFRISGQKFHELAYEMVDSASTQVNLSDFDNDENGVLDNFQIIFSYDAIYGIQGFLPEAYKKNGIIVNNFYQIPFKISPNKQKNYIISTLLSAADVPSYAYIDSSNLGNYLSKFISWHMDHFQILDAYSRSFLGWQKLKEIDAPQEITLPKPIAGNAESMQAYKLYITRETDSGQSEYYILENRQDTAMPGHGLLITHVKEKEIGRTLGKIYNLFGLKIISANPDYEHMQPADAPFPFGTNNEFSAYSNPSSITSTGKRPYFGIKNIVEHPDGSVSFSVVEDTAVHWLNICGSDVHEGFSQTFDQATLGATVDMDGWSSFDETNSGLQWTIGEKGNSKYAQVTPANLDSGAHFSSWLVSPSIKNDDPNKSISLTFLQSKKNWDPTYTAKVFILQCKGTKTYCQTIPLSDYPATTGIYDVLWKKFTKNINNIKGDFAIGFKLEGIKTKTDMSLCIDSVAVNYMNASSIQPQKEDFTQLIISINPVSNGELKMESGELINKIEIFNLFGQKVFSQTVNQNNITISVNHLPKGVYIVQCRFVNENMSNAKVIVN